MIRQVISKGFPGVELGCIIAAKESGIKTCGYTPYIGWDEFNIKHEHDNNFGVMKKNINLANGTIIVDILNTPSLRVEESIYNLYYKNDHNIIHVRHFHDDNINMLSNWINKYDINKLHIHSYNDLELFEKESYSFFMRLFNNLYKE